MDNVLTILRMSLMDALLNTLLYSGIVNPLYSYIILFTKLFTKSSSLELERSIRDMGI